MVAGQIFAFALTAFTMRGKSRINAASGALIPSSKKNPPTFANTSKSLNASSLAPRRTVAKMPLVTP
jgi:hypothetical protein